jgi:hypothetical protein
MESRAAMLDGVAFTHQLVESKDHCPNKRNSKFSSPSQLVCCY